MLLFLAALALLPQTIPDPRAAQRGCILEGLTPEQRTELAQRFVTGEMLKVVEIAKDSAAKCAATWKWTVETRDWNILHSSAYAAMVALEARLPKALGSARLEALFGKLSRDDQYGLTNQGAAKLDSAAYTALLRRIGALLAAEKVAEADMEPAGNWFIVYAQFIESDTQLKALAAGG